MAAGLQHDTDGHYLPVSVLMWSLLPHRLRDRAGDRMISETKSEKPFLLLPSSIGSLSWGDPATML